MFSNCATLAELDRDYDARVKELKAKYPEDCSGYRYERNLAAQMYALRVTELTKF